ncbi:MAG: YdiU family protein [Mariprofundaceae bacterium]|nr:YdiU family protein [Mariprofundaceae bacterium]
MAENGFRNPLLFDNSFVATLPGDPESAIMPRQVLGACYSRVVPTPVSAPETVACSLDLALMLGLTQEDCESDLFTEVFSGNRLLPGMEPYASCYGGHQFGRWAGQLGDGRAINLGELVKGDGQRWVLQLKGAGPTPYSRGADGLAVLRSSLREFLCSEAMFHLGVPTTRALSLIKSGEDVMRDMFYDGNAAPEPGAIVCRVAPSFTRFGSFEIFTSRQDFSLLKQLLDYTIRTDFPHLPDSPGAEMSGKEPSVALYLRWFEEVCRTTAELMVHWMRVGFVHGVMNTDNMSVLGLTIDYGPYGWLEGYDPGWTPNTTDAESRRYRFGNQPQIAMWNLTRLAEAIYPLINDEAPLQQALDLYAASYEQGWWKMMAAKLGFNSFTANSDEGLIEELLEILVLVETDMTIFFRRLGDISAAAEPGQTAEQRIAPLLHACYLPDDLDAAYHQRLAQWLDAYMARIRKDGLAEHDRRARMHAVNPKYVLRNYLAQQAIDSAQAGDYSMLHELLDLLRHPYDEQPGKERFAEKRPEWARHRAGCSMLSCSS